MLEQKNERFFDIPLESLSDGPITWEQELRTRRFDNWDISREEREKLTELQQKAFFEMKDACEWDGLLPVERAYRDRLRLACERYMQNPKDLEMVDRAISLALCKHATQLRDSGDIYSTHLFEVTLPLVEKHKLDAITIASALLHDVNEDQNVPLDYIAATIHPEVAKTVEALTKFKGEKIQKELAQEQANIKIITSLLENPRVAIIKLYDKLHNLKTLQAKHKPASRLRTLTEVREIYIPLSGLMGMKGTTEELEQELFYQEHRKKRKWFDRLEQTRIQKRWDQGEDYLRQFLKEDIRFPFSLRVWISSAVAMARDNGNVHYNVDIVLPRESLATGKKWGLEALSLCNAFGLSAEYDLVSDVDVLDFRNEVNQGLTDSLIFWAVKRDDGKRLHVHVYPEEASRLDDIPLTYLYYCGGENQALWHVLGEQKHAYLKERLTDRLERGEAISSQLARDLSPRLGASMIRIIGENDAGERFPTPIDVNSSGADFIKKIAPTNWPKVLSITVNGIKNPLDYYLQPGDVVHAEFGGHETWNPRLIHSFHTDMSGRREAQHQMEKLYRYFRRQSYEHATFTEIRQRILDEGIRQIELFLPEEERPLLVGTSRCSDIIQRYSPTKFRSEDILFHIGMGYVDESLVKEMGLRLREPNKQVGVLTLTFDHDKAGLIEAASHAVNTVTLEILNFIGSHSVRRDVDSSSVSFFTDPDDYLKAKELVPRVSKDAVCKALGLAYVTLRRRNESVWFSIPEA